MQLQSQWLFLSSFHYFGNRIFSPTSFFSIYLWFQIPHCCTCNTYIKMYVLLVFSVCSMPCPIYKLMVKVISLLLHWHPLCLRIVSFYYSNTYDSILSPHYQQCWKNCYQTTFKLFSKNVSFAYVQKSKIFAWLELVLSVGPYYTPTTYFGSKEIVKPPLHPSIKYAEHYGWKDRNIRHGLASQAKWIFTVVV